MPAGRRAANRDFFRVDMKPLCICADKANRALRIPKNFRIMIRCNAVVQHKRVKAVFTIHLCIGLPLMLRQHFIAAARQNNNGTAFLFVLAQVWHQKRRLLSVFASIARGLLP